VRAQRRDQAPQPFDNLPPAGSAGGTQQGSDHAALAVEHHDRLEAEFVMVCVEQA
jgi:hypothetical protein